MKKIAFVSYNLKVGGIQRSLINLLNILDSEKYKIDLYLYDNNIFYQETIPKAINIIFLKKRHKVLKFIPFKMIKPFFKSRINLEKYDFVIDFDGYQADTALEVLNFRGGDKICWVHYNSYEKYKEELKYRILHFFMKSKYKYFDEFVFVSKGIIEPFEKQNKLSLNKKKVVIPNVINAVEIIDKANEKVELQVDENKYNFSSLGRICKSKGFDILINYLTELKKYRKDFHFYLIGDGEDKHKIEKLVVKNKLKKYVTFLGYQQNPFKYLSLMDGFIFTSRYEGQGMVLWEAKVLGLNLFMPKNLEKYNEGLKGHTDLLKTLINAKKEIKKEDYLVNYNKNIQEGLEKLFNKNKTFKAIKKI